MISSKDVESLSRLAYRLRSRILEVGTESGGHVAASLSCVDILVCLYYGKVFSFGTSLIKSKDLIYVSKGHAELAVYAILERLGYIEPTALNVDYKRGRFKLGGHVDSEVPGVHFSSGSLGNGLGVVAGALWGRRLIDPLDNTYGVVLLGDGELCEGSIWESANFIGVRQIHNIVAIVDHNKLSATSGVGCILASNFIGGFEALGWDTHQVFGHSHQDLINGLNKCKGSQRPTLLVCDTEKGYPISAMKDDPIWHTKQMTEHDLRDFMKELENGLPRADIRSPI